MFKAEVQNGDFLDHLAKVTGQIQSLCKTDEFDFLPLANKPGRYFSALPIDSQIDVLNRLDALLNACLSCQSEGISFKNQAMLSWKILKSMGFTPTSDCFGRLKEDDLIQIYNLRNQLIFASLNFFKLVSYSLEELYCCSWMELFTRDPQITQTLYEYAMKVMDPSSDRTLEVPVPQHLVTETRAFHQSGIVKGGFFSPIYENGKVAGFLSSQQLAHVVNQRRPLPSLDK
ncbi:MAG: hypothetical protein AABY64_03265 [Bdellovibrionota bacterium]